MLRGNKPRIRFGNIMLGSEFLSHHFSPLLEWNTTLLYNSVVLCNSLPIKKKLLYKQCAGQIHLPAPFWDGVACRHTLSLGT